MLDYLEHHTPAGTPAMAARWSILWMHGLGADGHDFAPIVPELGLREPTRFLFPHAPVIPITCNGGARMRGWYDILALGPDALRQIDHAGVLQGREAIRALIAAENARGIPAERIVLAGFSQGGAMAYTVGLTHPERLGGIVALSTYLPAPDLLAAEESAANRTTPIFAAHGSFDPILPLMLGEGARQAVARPGRPLAWHCWPMPHTVCPEEIATLGAWLRDLQAAAGA